MTREEHTAIIQKINENITDVGVVTANLTALSDDYDKILTQNENLSLQATQLATHNDSLQKTNSELFLKVGTQEPPKEDEEPEEKEPEKLEYTDLFDEKGGLK